MTADELKQAMLAVIEEQRAIKDPSNYALGHFTAAQLADVERFIRSFNS